MQGCGEPAAGFRVQRAGRAPEPQPRSRAGAPAQPAQAAPPRSLLCNRVLPPAAPWGLRPPPLPPPPAPPLLPERILLSEGQVGCWCSSQAGSQHYPESPHPSWPRARLQVAPVPGRGTGRPSDRRPLPPSRRCRASGLGFSLQQSQACDPPSR